MIITEVFQYFKAFPINLIYAFSPVRMIPFDLFVANISLVYLISYLAGGFQEQLQFEASWSKQLARPHLNQ
jgi:hypothetical protein